jgi:hypothetical protein
MTKVIHIKDAPTGWKTNPEYVYIGRWNVKLELPASIFHNPFYMTGEDERQEACDSFDKHFNEREELKEQAIADLADKTLVCFCKPKRCHGDTLVNFVNQYQATHGKV